MHAGERLGWYAQHFEMVEVNSTFYSVPDFRMAERWCSATPDEFTFDVKLHQLFSFHSTPAKLLPPELQRRTLMDEKGNIERTRDLVDAMLKLFLRSMSILRSANKLGVEIRNRNWTDGEQLEETLEFFRRRHATLALVDAPAATHFTIMPSDIDGITNRDVAYLRLHGRNAEGYLTGRTVAARFNYNYRDDEVDDVAERSWQLAREADEVHVVFNNNALDYAPRAAIRLRKALRQLI